MLVNFYKNQSANNVINKSLDLLFTFENVIFKDDTNIIDITLETTFNIDIYKSNYIYISELDRYYFINNITLSQQSMFIECHIDVLMTYKTDLLQLTATVTRQENRFDTYLKDDEYLVEGYNRVQTIPFNTSFDNGECYILLVNGGSQNNNLLMQSEVE